MKKISWDEYNEALISKKGSNRGEGEIEWMISQVKKWRKGGSITDKGYLPIMKELAEQVSPKVHSPEKYKEITDPKKL